jgi:hypothetical protein
MTKSFEIAAKHAGMTDDETADLVTFLAENPKAVHSTFSIERAMSWPVRVGVGR